MRTRSQPSWDTPGTFEVASGVHRIPLPLPGDGLKAVNVYAIEDGDGLALVDTGSFRPESIAALEQGLSALDAGLTDITKVLATHAHYDHYGLAAKIRASSGAEVVIGDQETKLLGVAIDDDSFNRWVEHRRQWLGRHGAGALLDAIEGFERRHQLDTVRDSGRWEPPDRLLADGETVRLHSRTLHVHWTPGHTRGHIVYHDRANGLLFAGDHVLPHITPSLGFEPFADGRALELFLGSLAAIRDLPVHSVLPGHGPEFADLAGRVDALVEHHRVRLATCVSVISGEGARSADAVARQLTWTSRGRSFSELDPFNRMLAVTETVTHLEWLVESGRLQRNRAPDDTLAYALAA